MHYGASATAGIYASLVSPKPVAGVRTTRTGVLGYTLKISWNLQLSWYYYYYYYERKITSNASSLSSIIIVTEHLVCATYRHNAKLSKC